jgi:hypothetical protein
VSLVLGHPFDFSWLEISQTDVFHCSPPLGGSQRHSLARWIVHPIVVAHRKNRQQRRTISFQFPEPPRELLPRQGVSRFYNNLQDTRGLPNAAQVIQGFTNCGLRKLGTDRTFTNLHSSKNWGTFVCPQFSVPVFRRALRMVRVWAAQLCEPEHRAETRSGTGCGLLRPVDDRRNGHRSYLQTCRYNIIVNISVVVFASEALIVVFSH